MFTLASYSSATSITEVKRSKFIATVARADSEDEAREVIGQARRQYPDARHHCSAFVIASSDGPNRSHFSDDGEPSGTAGAPILDVLTASGLSNVVAVVTRYFGGTLLGTGGLVRAYSQATAAALRTATVVEVKTLELVEVVAPVEVGGRLDAEIRRAGWEIMDAQWGSDMRLEVALVAGDVDSLHNLVAETTRTSPNINQVGNVNREVRQTLDR